MGQPAHLPTGSGGGALGGAFTGRPRASAGFVSRCVASR